MFFTTAEAPRVCSQTKALPKAEIILLMYRTPATQREGEEGEEGEREREGREGSGSKAREEKEAKQGKRERAERQDKQSRKTQNKNKKRKRKAGAERRAERGRREGSGGRGANAERPASRMRDPTVSPHRNKKRTKQIKIILSAPEGGCRNSPRIEEQRKHTRAKVSQ